MAKGVSIDKKIKDAVVERAENEMAEKIANVLKNEPLARQNFEEVKRTAKNFLEKFEKIQQYEEGLKYYRSTKLKLKKATEANAPQDVLDELTKEKTDSHYGSEDNEDGKEFFYSKTETQQIVVTEKEAKDLLLAHTTFIKAINDFLGQKVVFQYVNENKEILEFTIDEMIENFDKHVSVGTQSGGSIIGKINDIKAEDGKITKQTVNKDWEQVYEEALRRFDYSKKKIKKSSKGFILWHIGQWYGMVVNAKGVLAEAYSGYNTMDPEASAITNIKNIERRVSVFMTGTEDPAAGGKGALFHGTRRDNFNIGIASKGVLGADFTRGTFQGDYASGDVQYAAKSVGASTQGYKMDAVFAKKLVEGGLSVKGALEISKTEAKKAARDGAKKLSQVMTLKKVNDVLDSLNILSEEDYQKEMTLVLG